MKILSLLLTLIIFSSTAFAEGENGVGIVLGDPTGLTFQHKLSNDHFMDFTFAYDFHHEDWMLIGDYKVKIRNLIDSSIPLTPYVGGGLFLHIEDQDKGHKDEVVVGLRIPLGVEWRVPQAPVTLFVEVAPGMEFIPATDGEIQAGIGGRFFF